jgi:alpha-L-rhamnosidase
VTSAESSSHEVWPAGELAGHARWIGRDPAAVEEVEPRYPDDRPGITLDLSPPDLLRAEVAVRPGVRRAEVLATARGLFRCWIDGRRVGDDELAPGWTDYRVRMPVRRYDVTGLVAAASGRLCWSAVVADGWFCGYVGMDRRRQARWYGTAPSLRAALRIDHDDGVDIVGTDHSWRRSEGAVRYADLLMGEMIDVSREPQGWRHVGFDDSGWPAVTELPDDHVELTESVDPPVRVIDVLAPTEVWARPDERLVVDFGANIVGRLRIDTAGLPAGTRLHLRHGEEVVDGEVYTANLRTARAHDIVVTGDASPDGPIEPTFTLHGFRYAEIAGHPGPPDAIHESVRAVVLASDLGRVGMFECSDEATNRLHENVVRTIRGNTVGLPTDCPQRDERLGWMADTQLSAPTTAHLFDCGTFFDQWFVAMRDGQSANGAFPDVVPKLVVDVDGAPGWADAGILVPWAVHRHDGDRGRLARHYPAMVRFLDWIEAANPDLIRRRGVQHNYGDWLALEVPVDKALLATAYWAFDVTVMAAMAAALGRADDVERWNGLARRLRAAFAAEFVGDATDLRISGQTGLAMALALGLVPSELQPLCATRLVAAIDAAGGALATGIHGTRFVLPALCDTSHVDVAYALLTRRGYPSWQYSIDQGATTIWERWDGSTIEHGLQTPALNSMNHPALGSVAEWMHAYVAGLRPADDRLEIRPYPGGGLSGASTETHVRGSLAGSSWRIDGGEIELRCTVPPGVEATVYVPSTRAVADRGWERHTVGPGEWGFRAPWDVSWRPGVAGHGLLFGAGTALP